MYGYVVGPKPRQPGDIVADPAEQRWTVRIYPYKDLNVKKANLLPDTVPFDTIGKLYVSNLIDKVDALLPDDFDTRPEKEQDEAYAKAQEEAYTEAVQQIPILYGVAEDLIPTELYFLEGDTVFRHVQPTVSPAEMHRLNAEHEKLGGRQDENVNENVNLSILVELDGVRTVHIEPAFLCNAQGSWPASAHQHPRCLRANEGRNTMKQYDILQCTRMHPCDPILTAPSLNLYLSATVLILCAFDSFCGSIASGTRCTNRVSGWAPRRELGSDHRRTLTSASSSRSSQA